jgi:hypothetical protein
VSTAKPYAQNSDKQTVGQAIDGPGIAAILTAPAFLDPELESSRSVKYHWLRQAIN